VRVDIIDGPLCEARNPENGITMSQLYVGVDGGGSYTRAIVANQFGIVLGAGYAGSTNRNHHSRDEVRANFRQAIRDAIGGIAGKGKIEVMFLGMSAVSTDADRADIISIIREVPEVPQTARVLVDNDTSAGLAGGLSGRPGMVLIAGTGSICLGVRQDKRSYMCGGWGALADDAGSAAWVGSRAIEAAVRSEDGRLGPTSLRRTVFDFLELAEPRQLIDRIHNRGLDRAQIGLLAPLVVEACRGGDVVAGGILHGAVAELSLLVRTTALHLYVTEPCELVLVGGFALSGPPFQTMLIERIQQDTPSVRVLEPEMSPVQGGVLLARRAEASPPGPEFITNLKTFNL
jgi:glucosamine kinase